MVKQRLLLFKNIRTNDTSDETKKYSLDEEGLSLVCLYLLRNCKEMPIKVAVQPAQRFDY